MYSQQTWVIASHSNTQSRTTHMIILSNKIHKGKDNSMAWGQCESIDLLSGDHVQVRTRKNLIAILVF